MIACLWHFLPVNTYICRLKILYTLSSYHHPCITLLIQLAAWKSTYSQLVGEETDIQKAKNRQNRKVRKTRFVCVRKREGKEEREGVCVCYSNSFSKVFPGFNKVEERQSRLVPVKANRKLSDINALRAKFLSFFSI